MTDNWRLWLQRAHRRVRRSERLRAHFDVIFSDWPERDHYQWLVEADEAEIVDWATDIETAALAERAATGSDPSRAV